MRQYEVKFKCDHLIIGHVFRKDQVIIFNDLNEHILRQLEAAHEVRLLEEVVEPPTPPTPKPRRKRGEQ